MSNKNDNMEKLTIIRTVRLPAGEAKLIATFQNKVSWDAEEAIERMENLASFTLQKAFDEANISVDAHSEITGSPPAAKTPEPLPGTAFFKGPETAPAPEEMPAAAAPEQPPGSAPETTEPSAETAPGAAVETAPSKTPKLAKICSQCEGPVDESDLKAAFSFIPKEHFGKVLCPECLRIFKDSQLKNAPLPIPWTETEFLAVFPPEAPAPEPELPSPAPVPEPSIPTVAKCEKCGANITKAEMDLSKMFMGKPLCKKCLEGGV
jgi:hypothetical protein